MTPESMRNELWSKLNENLDQIFRLIKRKGIEFDIENEYRLIQRLKVFSKIHGYKNFKELYKVLEEDPKVFNNLVQLLRKGKNFNEQYQLYESLITIKDEKKDINSLEKHFRKNKIMEISENKQNQLFDLSTNIKNKKVEIKPSKGLFKKKLFLALPDNIEGINDPYDANNLSLIYNFLAQKKINYQAYKQKYFLRRLNARIKKKKLLTYHDYYKLLQTDPSEIQNLISNLSINVTWFFRDSDLFQKLKNEIFPKLYKSSKGPIKIWSAGCAVGAEPYSIAIIIFQLFKEHGLKKTNILATDNELEFLMKANKGIFFKDLLKEVDPIIMNTYFREKDPNNYQISDMIRKSVNFQVHDLLDPAPVKNVDLILCRNVLIYFSRDQSIDLLQKFYNALNSNGLLILGKCELIPAPIRSNFKTVDSRSRIYQVIKD